MQNHYCIIMAGGIGSRFWPVSQEKNPKQFLDILGTGKSFIRSTFERFLPVVPAKNFIVVTNATYKDLVLQHIPELSEDQVLCEPIRRNTAPCIAYASYHILSKNSKAKVVVTPADHLVINEKNFHRVISSGFNFVSDASNANALLTIGIRPTRPETGYGYIQIPKSICETTISVPEITKVLSFTEKPNLERAKQFLKSGRYLWNSGIFIWSLEGILSALRTYTPQITAIFDEGQNVFGSSDEQNFINENFHRCPDISIDYGVMEKSPKTYTIPADFGWSDIGTWGSLFTNAIKDTQNNAINGNAIVEGTTNSIINIAKNTKAIIQGLDNYLVAFYDNSLLVCRLSDEQKIKEWVSKLNSTK